MILRHGYLMDNCCGALATNWQSTNMSSAFLQSNMYIKTNFNKTWHGDCRSNVVSKILDWLVL